MSGVRRLVVIVCTHDPREDYFRRTLDGLRAQTLSSESWSVVVVDNASEPPIAASVLDGLPTGSRIVPEKNPGLTNARLRGMAETTEPLLIFVDDDNVLAPDYLEKTLEIDGAWPQLGCWNGHTHGEFEVTPPDWTQRFWPRLAVRPVDREVWSNDFLHFPVSIFGAGLAVRRQVADAYARGVADKPWRLTMDRVGGELTGGGDSDICFTAVEIGLGVGVFPKLSLTHLISARRLEEDYLLRLVRGGTSSFHLLSYYHGGPPPVPRPGRAERLLRWYQRLASNAPEIDKKWDDAYAAGIEDARRAIERIQASTVAK